jgi:hypothetical protein
MVEDDEYEIPVCKNTVTKMAYCLYLEGIFLQKEQCLKGLSQICFVAIFGFYEQVGLDQLTDFLMLAYFWSRKLLKCIYCSKG